MMALLHWVRLAALVSSCVALGLVTHVGGLKGRAGAWCVFCWAFSFTGTLLVSLVEIFHLNMNIHEFWINLSATFSSYAALLCLSTSIIFPYNFLKGRQSYDVHNHLAAAEFFSCVVTLVYLAEVHIARVQMNCYMASTQGLLQVCQTYVAGFILFFISNPVAYADQAAARWCMAVYCICFIFSVVGILMCVFCNQRNLACLKSLHVCASVMYLSATITWPVFKLDGHYPSQTYPPDYCQEGLGLCPWGRLVVVAVLTALNFLLYSLSTWYLCTVKEDDQQYCTVSATFTIHFNRPSQQYTSDLTRQVLIRGGRCVSPSYQSVD